MASFSSVTATLTVGQIGQLGYGEQADLLVRSYVLVNATDVPPGRGVVYDAANQSAMLPNAGSQLFLGVAFNDGSLPIEQAAYDNAATCNMPVLRRGQVWVETSTGCAPTDPVFFQHTAGVGKPAGSFRIDNDGGAATQITAGAQWAGVYSSGKALLQINLPA